MTWSSLDVSDAACTGLEPAHSAEWCAGGQQYDREGARFLVAAEAIELAARLQRAQSVRKLLYLQLHHLGLPGEHRHVPITAVSSTYHTATLHFMQIDVILLPRNVRCGVNALPLTPSSHDLSACWLTTQLRARSLRTHVRRRPDSGVQHCV